MGKRKPRVHSEWLNPSEVAKMFGVHLSTVTRWAREDKLSFTVTLGGHRRFSRQEVQAVLSKDWDSVASIRKQLMNRTAS
ncbi:MAG TPA: helix-turn-helix domain-containing protein [Candidatus Tectomicrobia bacterium]